MFSPGVLLPGETAKTTKIEVGVLNQLAKTAKFETNKSSFSAPKSMGFFVAKGWCRVQGLRFLKIYVERV